MELRDPAAESAAEPAAAETDERTSMLRSYVATVGATPLAIALTIFGIFLSVVVIPYGFSDDYPLLWMADGGGPSVQFGKTIVDAGAINGRPIAGLLTQWFFSAAGSIDHLRFVRLVGVLGIIGVALLLQWALVRSRIRPVVAALITILVCSTPAFQVWGSWTLLFSVPFGALAAGGASRMTVAAVDGPRRLMTDRLVAAGALLVGALLTYQPAAMFFWVFFAVALIGAAAEPVRGWRLVKAHFAVAGAAFVIAYVVIKISVRIIGSDAQGAARNTLVHDYGAKIHWFFDLPLYQALNLFKLVPSLWLALPVASIATVGMLLLIFQRCARPWLYLGVGLALIPLSFLPNLVVAENSPTFRVQVALTGLIALYAALGSIGIWLAAREWLTPRVSHRGLVRAEHAAATLGVFVVAMSVFFAAKNVLTLFADPQMTELRLLRQQVRALPDGVSRVAFVQTGYTQGLTKLALVGEFGVPTSVQLFNLEPSVLLLLHEEGRLPVDGIRPTVDIFPPTTTTPPKDEPAIDLRGMQNLR